MTYYIYILYSKTIDRSYIGYSTNPWKRLEQHLTNSPDKYTGKAKDWELQVLFSVGSEEKDAIRLERFIKRQKTRNGYVSKGRCCSY